jgi:asparagine synthase (glutamine-hydrolysing)
MAGIAGVLKEGQQTLVTRMLETISHRGNHGKAVFDYDDATIGMVWAEDEENRVLADQRKGIFSDGPGFGHKVEVTNPNHHWQITRDELGVVPMYYTYTNNGTLCFASEVKALMHISSGIIEILPGCTVTDSVKNTDLNPKKRTSIQNEPGAIASDLLNLLTMTITRRISSDSMGAWLSGGLDSSAIATLAKPWVKDFHTFAGGLRNAPDLEFAREVASHIRSTHHEVIIDFKDMLRILPRVIYHLESFDALLVRSSIINYLVADRASGYVGEAFSGEVGDELFAGYQYLKTIKIEDLDQELLDITCRLHNTALQRVDRCAAAHGLRAHVVFADPDFVDFALRIPAAFKLKDGIEKWILRKAMEGMMPDRVLWRPKAKFWEGAGVESLFADYANKKVTDKDFSKERLLHNGWTLHTKEELFYYRIFCDHFGELENLDWMGRTKVVSEPM